MSDPDRIEPTHDHEQMPTPAQLREVVKLIGTVANLDQLLEVQTGRDFDNFIGACRDLPPLPFKRESIFALVGSEGLVAEVDLFPHPSPTRTLTYLHIETFKAVRAVTHSPLNSTENVITAARQAIAGGKYEKLSAALEKAFQAEGSAVPRVGSMLTPIALMFIATFAATSAMEQSLTPEEQRLPAAERDKIAINRSDHMLREFSQQIIDNDFNVWQDFASSSITTLVDAMRALQRCYNLLETDKEKAAIMTPLASVKMVANSLNPVDGTRRGNNAENILRSYAIALNKLARPMADNGIEIGQELIDQVASSDTELPKITAPKSDLLDQVQQAHKTIRMRQIARSLVHGIARGEFSITLLYAVAARLYAPMLKVEAVTVQQRRQAELDAQAAKEKAEEDRLKDLDYLLVQLNLDPDNEVEVEIDATHSSTSEGAATEAHHNQAAKEAINRIEPHRLLILAKLQQAYPGSKIWFRTIDSNKKGKSKIPTQPTAASADTRVDPAKVRGYLVLALSNGRALGEALGPRNATYVFWPEVWNGDINWQQAFGFDEPTGFNKANGLNAAMVRIEHPSARDLEANYLETVEYYVMLVRDELDRKLAPGEIPPDLGVMRSLRRIGIRAVTAAQTQR